MVLEFPQGVAAASAPFGNLYSHAPLVSIARTALILLSMPLPMPLCLCLCLCLCFCLCLCLYLCLYLCLSAYASTSANAHASTIASAYAYASPMPLLGRWAARLGSDKHNLCSESRRGFFPPGKSLHARRRHLNGRPVYAC